MCLQEQREISKVVLFETQEQKDAEIHRREYLLNTLKSLMGL